MEGWRNRGQLKDIKAGTKEQKRNLLILRKNSAIEMTVVCPSFPFPSSAKTLLSLLNRVCGNGMLHVKLFKTTVC